MRRLLEECKIGLGNAALLAEAIVVCKPQDLKKKGNVIPVRFVLRFLPNF